ncbi:hypothetical protein BRADI_1g45653v3 [Brachypodium distachyon]|uniref:Uncharacterized protein n=1 Tax=Brachypodium distachyon TaxID=15368 RepID=A0A0Q3H7F6_BRADI|nr:hypothetical protein BRADI_1g45653v3 [Brachypodium distachyon]
MWWPPNTDLSHRLVVAITSSSGGRLHLSPPQAAIAGMPWPLGFSVARTWVRWSSHVGIFGVAAIVGMLAGGAVMVEGLGID